MSQELPVPAVDRVTNGHAEEVGAAGGGQMGSHCKQGLSLPSPWANQNLNETGAWHHKAAETGGSNHKRLRPQRRTMRRPRPQHLQVTAYNLEMKRSEPASVEYYKSEKAQNK
jgi:hypothetical protein